MASFLILAVAVIVSNGASKEAPAIICPAWNLPGIKVLIPHPDDCEMYYKCVFGLPYLKTCPFVRGQKLRFNPVLKTCDWPWNVVCKDATTTTGEEPEPTTPPPDSCKKPGEYKIKDSYYCNVYYECEDSKLSEPYCCSSGPFNEKTQKCENKEGPVKCTPWQLCAEF